MATLTIRNLPEQTLAAFRIRAAEHGRSMEAEARTLIQAFVEDSPTPSPSRAEIRERVRRAQEKVQAMFGGEAPKGLVDAFIAERRAAASGGE